MDDRVILGNEHLSNDEEEDDISDDGIDSIELVEDDSEPTRLDNINRIVHLVLSRLPARSLLRFKSVSPNFYNLISSPFMVLSHFLHPKRVSGLFYQTGSSVHYVSFGASSTDLPDPSFSYLPEPVTIKASTHGMLCVRGQQTLDYYITNPLTMEWVELPETTVEHCDNVAVVVAFDEPSVYNFSFIYRVVCAYPVKDLDGVYTFETFSSETWTWARSNEICAVVNIVAESGTAVGAVAHWRTAMDTVLSYDPLEDRSNIIPKPHTDMEEVWWELGEMDRHLSVTSKSQQGQIIVSTMPNWNEMGNFWLDETVPAIPIRSQGSAGLVFWEYNGDVMELVLRDMQGRPVCRFQEPNYYSDFVFFPYISTLVPVNR